MNHMSPLQMLVRLRAIEAELAMPETLADQVRNLRLLDERAAILSGIGRPPAELMLTPEPTTWAGAFAALHAVDPVTVYEWFAKFRDQVAQQHYGLGHEDGRRNGAQNLSRLVALNKTILALLESRRMTNILIRDDNNPDAPQLRASEHIRQQLRSLGVEVDQ